MMKKHTTEEWVRFGFTALFVVGVVCTLMICLAWLNR
jgi:hypothetical protein